MPDLIDPQQLLRSDAASNAVAGATQPPAPPAADALGSTRTAQTSTAPLIADVGTDELVSGQLKKLLGEDSLVLQQARERSKQFSAGRGLQNSTMAAQAGEQAVIAAATPIASADAAAVGNRRSQNLSTVNQFGLTERQENFARDSQGREFQQQREMLGAQTDANSRLQGEAATQELTRLREQGTINERLQAMDQNFRALESLRDREAREVLQSREFQQSQTLLLSEYAQRAGLSRQEADQEIARINRAHENTLEQITAQSDATRDAELGPRLQQQYLASVSDRMRSASEEIQAISTTQGLTAVQQSSAIAAANARMTSDLATLQAYFAQSPLWDPNYGAGGSSTPADGPQQLIPTNPAYGAPSPTTDQLAGWPVGGDSQWG